MAEIAAAGLQEHGLLQLDRARGSATATTGRSEAPEVRGTTVLGPSFALQPQTSNFYHLGGKSEAQNHHTFGYEI